jgi:tetratricopeptide (TPR) repeat protein
VEKEFKSGHSNRLAFYVGGLAGLFALAVHSVVDFNLHIPANALIGVTLLALLSSNLRFATEKFWFNVRLPVKLVVTVALAGGIVYLGAQEIHHGRETFWLARADRLPVFSPEQSAALEKAFAAEPQNPATTYAIGECYRMQSFEGGSDYETQAKTAMDWYSRGMKLNPHDGFNYMSCGMCLDWLERHDEAEASFNRADELDPNGYFVAANIGWHYVQAGNYAAARPWLVRSLKLQWNENPTAHSYLDLVEQKLRDNAAGKSDRVAGF